MCSVCAPGYAHSFTSGTCAECLDPALNTFVLTLSVLVVAAVCCFVVVKFQQNAGNVRGMFDSVLRIALSWAQLMSVFATVELEWPSSLSALFAVQGTASGLSTFFATLECALGRGDVDGGIPLVFRRSLVMSLLPFACVFLPGAFWGCWYKLRLRRVRKQATSFLAISGRGSQKHTAEDILRELREAGVHAAAIEVDGHLTRVHRRMRGHTHNPTPRGVDTLSRRGRDSDTPWTDEDDSPDGAHDLSTAQNEHAGTSLAVGAQHVPRIMDAVVWSHVRNRFTLSVVVLLFLVLPRVSLESFRLLACRTLESDDESFLTADPRISCSSAQYLAFGLGIGLGSIMVWVIAAPAAVMLLLYRRRKKLGEVKTLYKLGFLYSGYSRRTWFWEAVVYVRKTLAALIAVWQDPVEQIRAGLLVVFFALLLHARYKPFLRAKRLDRLETASLLSSYAVLFALQLMLPRTIGGSGASEGMRLAAAVVVFAASISFAGIFMHSVCITVSESAHIKAMRNAIRLPRRGASDTDATDSPRLVGGAPSDAVAAPARRSPRRDSAGDESWDAHFTGATHGGVGGATAPASVELATVPHRSSTGVAVLNPLTRPTRR